MSYLFLLRNCQSSVYTANYNVLRVMSGVDLVYLNFRSRISLYIYTDVYLNYNIILK